MRQYCAVHNDRSRCMREYLRRDGIVEDDIHPPVMDLIDCLPPDVDITKVLIQ